MSAVVLFMILGGSLVAAALIGIAPTLFHVRFTPEDVTENRRHVR